MSRWWGQTGTCKRSSGDFWLLLWSGWLRMALVLVCVCWHLYHLVFGGVYSWTYPYPWPWLQSPVLSHYNPREGSRCFQKEREDKGNSCLDQSLSSISLKGLWSPTCLSLSPSSCLPPFSVVCVCVGHAKGLFVLKYSSATLKYDHSLYNSFTKRPRSKSIYTATSSNAKTVYLHVLQSAIEQRSLIFLINRKFSAKERILAWTKPLLFTVGRI